MFIGLCVFDIFDHKMQISSPCWLETIVAHGNRLVTHL